MKSAKTGTELTDRPIISWLRLSLVLTLIALAAIAAQAQDNDAIKKEFAQLDGEWTLVSGTNDGNPFPAGMLASARRICTGNTVALMNGTQTVMRATMILNLSKKPKTLDYQVNEGPSKGKKRLGIYELNGDSFKSCFGAADAERPKTFVSKGGDGCVMTVWKRVKR